MKEIKLCIGGVSFKGEPIEKKTFKDNAKYVIQCESELLLFEIERKIYEGYCFCPAVFENQKNKEAYFKEMQLFCLVFDADSLTLEEALDRTKYYDILPAITYSYNTDKRYFVLIFQFNEPIVELRIVKLVYLLLFCIFPEAQTNTINTEMIFYPGDDTKLLSEKPIYIDSLLFAAQEQSELCGKSNWLARLQRIQNRTGIVTVGSSIYYTDEKVENNVNFSSVPLYIINELEPELTNLAYFYFSSDINDSEIPKPNRKESPFYSKTLDISQKTCYCRLIDEFVKGILPLSGSELTGVMTNLIYINGGQSLFTNALEKHYSLYLNRKRASIQMLYAINNSHEPLACNSFCPYCNGCDHEVNIIDTFHIIRNLIRRLNTQHEYISLEAARRQLSQVLDDALQKEKRMTVIKTQTGVGKTYYALKKIIRNSDMKFIYALPNNSLKNEVYKKFIAMGGKGVCIPSTTDLIDALPKDKSEIAKKLYKIGGGEFVLEKINEWNEKEPDETITLLLKAIKNAVNFDGNVFTTHSRLKYMGEKALANKTVIIDEDIFQTLLTINSVEVSDLKKFLAILQGNGRYTLLELKIMSILNHIEKKEKYFNDYSNEFYPSLKDFAEMIIKSDCKINSCILGVINAETFYYNKHNNTISFTDYMQLDTSCNY